MYTLKIDIHTEVAVLGWIIILLLGIKLVTLLPGNLLSKQSNWLKCSKWTLSQSHSINRYLYLWPTRA